VKLEVGISTPEPRSKFDAAARVESGSAGNGFDGQAVPLEVVGEVDRQRTGRGVPRSEQIWLVLDDVCAVARTHGGLSYHFDDKDSLILAALERATNELREASIGAAEAVEGEREKVVAFLRGSFTDKFLNSDYLRLRVSLWAVSLTDPDLAKIDTRYYREYSAALQTLMAAALPSAPAADVAARTTDVVAYTNGLWLDWARFQDEMDLERGLIRAERIALDS